MAWWYLESLVINCVLGGVGAPMIVDARDLLGAKRGWLIVFEYQILVLIIFIYRNIGYYLSTIKHSYKNIIPNFSDFLEKFK